jgi:phospholipase C
MRSLQKMKSACRGVALAAGMSIVMAPGMTAPAFAHQSTDTATPVEHLVVIFQENVSFDHYFGTYPFAANTVQSG